MTNYDKVTKSMTIERLAQLGVKMVNVDNRRLFYMTSTGQLYPLDTYEEAIAHELRWLNEEIEEEQYSTEPTEK